MYWDVVNVCALCEFWVLVCNSFMISVYIFIVSFFSRL